MTWEALKKDQRLALIVEVWDDNSSASSIAASLSAKTGSQVSHNSIIGLYNRNSKLRKSHPLTGRGHSTQHRNQRTDGLRAVGRRKAKRDLTRTVTLKAPVVENKAKVRVSEAARAYDQASRHVLLHELAHNECSWPVNDPALGEKHRFCGHPTPDGKHYCTHHQGRSVPRSKRK